MDPDDQHLFVVRAVENADAAALGQAFHVAPQIVVVQFFRGGSLEGINLAALRIHAGHHVLDDAVFSGRIHGLKNQQQAPAVLGVELVLQLGHAGDALGQQFFGTLLGVSFAVSAGSWSFRRNFLPCSTR